MSYWSTFIGIVQKFCEEDPEIEEMLKQTDQLQKDNDMYENELEDHEREHTRLQIELFNVETMMEPLTRLASERSVEETNHKLMESCTNIRYAISQIDFVKILQCNHMKMEQNWRQEWQQMQDYSVSILKWHDKMEQRDVVQRYRKVEMTYKETQTNLERHQKSMEKSLKESSTCLGKVTVKRNALILSLIEGIGDLQNMRKEYQMLQEYSEKIESMKKKKSELMEQLEKAESKNFCSLLPYKSVVHDNASTSKVLQPFLKDDFPKFPSFAEILKSFNQDLNTFETNPEITVIENTTNITVKSILRNSQDNSMEINQSITTKHTKHVRFKLQLEEQFEFTDYTDTATSDTSSEDLQETGITVTPQLEEIVYEDSKDPKIEKEKATIVALLTPSISTEIAETECDTDVDEENQPPKTKVDILECIVIQPPLNSVNDDLPPQGEENIPPGDVNTKDSEDYKNKKKTDEEIMPPPPSPAEQKRRDKHSKKFFDELLRYSSSSNNTSGSESGILSARSVLKDFNSYMNESKVEKPKEENTNQTKNNPSDSIDFMDFDTNFNLDSNDENEDDGGMMDFLLS